MGKRWYQNPDSESQGQSVLSDLREIQSVVGVQRKAFIFNLIWGLRLNYVVVFEVNFKG